MPSPRSTARVSEGGRLPRGPPTPIGPGEGAPPTRAPRDLGQDVQNIRSSVRKMNPKILSWFTKYSSRARIGSAFLLPPAFSSGSRYSCGSLCGPQHHR